MEDLKLHMYPNTRVGSLLVMLPIAMSWLEKHGVNPFSLPEPTLEDVCRQSGLTWEGLLEELSSLEAPKRNSDWDHLPLCHLLEFLTREHREFKQDFLTAIRNAFSAGEGKRDFLGRLLPLVMAWPGFSASLIEHMGAEETYLFPKILRYEYCSVHGRAEPDFSNGSIKVFTALHLMRNEQKQEDTIRDFLDASSFSADSGEMDAQAAGLFRMLAFFQSRLLEHSRMERKILFPRAEALEKELLDRAIDGGMRKPIHPEAGISR